MRRPRRSPPDWPARACWRCGSSAAGGTAASAARPAEQRDDLAEVRDHLRRYRDLMSQGKYSEAGKEIEALERMAAKK